MTDTKYRAPLISGPPGRHLLGAAACLVVLAGITGCTGGSTGGSHASVASVPTGSHSASPAPSADPDAGRPQLRVDTTDAERSRLLGVWARCVRDHGAKMQTVVKDGLRMPVEQNDPRWPAAQRACLSKLPLSPPELDPKTNPHYSDDFAAWIKCMHKDGFMAEPAADGSGWTYPEGPVPSNARQIEKKCQLQAFGRKKN